MNQPILCRAAVAYEPKKPLVIQQIWVDPPKDNEVRLKVISNALCHTDIYTLDGCDPQGKFPCILGHQATAIVESIGADVKRVNVGDIVIPCYTPQCDLLTCIYCQNQNTNLCPAIRSTQGQGLMPDGTSRFKNKQGKTIYHFMGCSTFSEYTVVAQISVAKINKNADLTQVCMIGCGISTGWGAVFNNANVQPGTTVAVWGLGAVGLAVIQAAKLRGASKIYAIDINDKKFTFAKQLGADVCYVPIKQKDGKAFLLEQQKWGIHYTFDATGNTQIMRQALESSHRGYGLSCIIGVAEAGKQISTRSFQLVTGRKWIGTAFGGWKSVQDVPKLVNKTLLGQLPINTFVTHKFDGINEINEAIKVLHQGQCLRAIINISPYPSVNFNYKLKILSSNLYFGGLYQTVSHWSQACQSQMKFGIYIPQSEIHNQRGKPFPALYLLAQLQATHQDFPTKSGFGSFAKKHKIACIFPDTSPRKTGIPHIDQDWTCGDGASYYIDSTSEKTSKYFQMFTYITEELPRLVSQYFPVSFDNKSMTGFSMGGHGALLAGLKTKKYKSVSAFAPISNPTKVLGVKAYQLFFKDSQKEGKEHDATEILNNGKYQNTPLFVDVASNDQYQHLVVTKTLKQALIASKYKHIWKNRIGYNHSYWFISSFIEEHFNFHAKYLNYQ